MMPEPAHDNEGNIIRRKGEDLPTKPQLHLQSGRQNEIDFLARESTEIREWKVIYDYKMKEWNITESEVLARTSELRAPRRFLKIIEDKPVKALPKLVAPADTLIYCWPYHAESQTSYGAAKNRKMDPMLVVVSTFTLIWIIATMLLIGIKFYGFFGMFKAVPLMLLPLLGMLKGLTHIRVNQAGVTLESASGKSTLKTTVIPWSSIQKVYVDMPEGAKTPLAGSLVLELSFKKQRKIALKKIASGEQWRRLIESMAPYTNIGALDPALMDGLNQGTTRDPSYTKLWLDALRAPPRRERLQPLWPGVELQKGQYKVERLLGSGGQGSAYLASSPAGQVVLKEYILPVYVDVKVKRQALEEFEHESKILRALNHKNIVKSVGSFIEDHRAYLLLEYIQGSSLRQLVEEGGPLPELQCAKFGMEMCEILRYLHKQSPAVVHQDFTPDNLLVAPDGSLKLIDFMVAKQVSGDSATGIVVGKHHYMPPEQFRGKATTRSDIYALGCTMHFILTGLDPEPMSPSHPILHNDAISGAMDQIVEKATMLQQDQRYQEADTIEQDLREIINREQEGLGN